MKSNRLEHVPGTTFHNRTRSDFRISFGVLNNICMNLHHFRSKVVPGPSDQNGMSYLCKSHVFSDSEKSLKELWASCSCYGREGEPWSSPSLLSSVPGAQAHSQRSPPLKHGVSLGSAHTSAVRTGELGNYEWGMEILRSLCWSCFRLKTRWLSDVLRRLSRPSSTHKHEREMCNYGQRSNKHLGPLIDFHTMLWSGDKPLKNCLFTFICLFVHSFIHWLFIHRLFFVCFDSLHVSLFVCFCLFDHSLFLSSFIFVCFSSLSLSFFH